MEVDRRTMPMDVLARIVAGNQVSYHERCLLENECPNQNCGYCSIARQDILGLLLHLKPDSFLWEAKGSNCKLNLSVGDRQVVVLYISGKIDISTI